MRDVGHRPCASTDERKPDASACSIGEWDAQQAIDGDGGLWLRCWGDVQTVLNEPWATCGRGTGDYRPERPTLWRRRLVAFAQIIAHLTVAVRPEPNSDDGGLRRGRGVDAEGDWPRIRLADLRVPRIDPRPLVRVDVDSQTGHEGGHWHVRVRDDESLTVRWKGPRRAARQGANDENSENRSTMDLVLENGHYGPGTVTPSEPPPTAARSGAGRVR